MGWFRAHPYILTLAVVIIVLVGGGMFVASRAPVAPTQSITWGGGAPISSYQNAAPQQTPQQIAQDVITSQAPSTLSLPALATSTSSSSFAPTSGSFDYVALLAQLSGSAQVPSNKSSSAAQNPAIAQAYQYIPTGLIATTTETKHLTAAQEALYDYGNDVGDEIQSFENLHTNEAQILKDQAEDRTDPAKNAAVVSLAQGFTSVGTYMQQMQDVPDSIQPLHNALAQSYLDVGSGLQAITAAQSDSDFIQAIEKYDDTADTFVRNYAALAQFFSEQGVTFSSQDGGSVFSFTDTGGGGGL